MRYAREARGASRTRRLPGIGLAILGLFPGARVLADTEAEVARQSREYEKNIAGLVAIDREYPPAILAQFDYAKYLTRSHEGRCDARLDKAEATRRLIENNAATQFVLPDGAARLAQLAYRIASGRAECVKNKVAKAQWSEQARTAAQQAVALYRDLHAYGDMAVMQFNLAEEARRSGNRDLALAELRTALEMDEGYGMREDAVENLRFMGQWQETATTDVQVAELMNRYADRTVIPVFDWRPGTIAGTYVQASEHRAAGKQIHSAMRAAFTDTVVVAGEELLEESKLADVRSESSAAAQMPELDARMSAAVAQAMSHTPTLRLGRGGEFRGAERMQEFIDGFTVALEAVPDQILPAGDPRRATVERNIQQWLKSLGDEKSWTERVQRDYEIHTSMWSGLALTQGEWRRRTARMSMPGTPQVYVDHDVQYAFTARVPCVAADSETRCIELLVHATPTDAAIEQIRNAVAKAGKGRLAYWGTTRCVWSWIRARCVHMRRSRCATPSSRSATASRRAPTSA